MAWAASAFRSKVISLALLPACVHRLERVQRDRGAQGDDVVDGRVLLQLGLQGRGHRGVVRAVDLDVLRAGDLALDTGAASLQRHRAGLPGSRTAGACRPRRRSARRRSLPARFSSEPKYISAPSSLYWSMPELNPTTGIPASVADFTAPASASGVTRVVAMPSTLESTAFWISCACLSAAGSLEYFSVMPVSLAACCGAGPDLVPEGVARGLVGDHGDRVARVAATAAAEVVGGGRCRAAATAGGHGEDESRRGAHGERTKSARDHQ